MKNYLILFSIILVICAPLFKKGFYTSQDGEHHLIRTVNFAGELKKGNFFPGWINNLNKGLGYPIFYFAYPLPYYLTGIINILGFSAIDSLKTTFVLATAASVLIFWHWSENMTATLIFAFTPYRFLNLYVRASLGEIVFIPMVLGAFLGVKNKNPFLVSLFLVLMLLSHLQLSLIFIPILILYSRNFIKSIFAGLLLSLFFWLPAIWLLPLTKHVQTLQFLPYQHIPGIAKLIYSKWDFGFSPNGMSFQIGLAQILILILTVYYRPKRLFLALNLFAIFLMTELSVFIWKNPLFYQIQFPWRLLMVPMILTPFLLPKRIPKFITIFLIILAIYSNRNHIRINQTLYENVNDSYFLNNAGTTTATSDEFMPLVSKSQFINQPIIFWSRLISGVSLLVWGLLLLKSRYEPICNHNRPESF